ncbi:discoidin domain-containing protein [Micromonospora sp. NPDC005299]|uniref:discoidin domain-containing protein n=1 Tax=Micromonospora sp. NPDC005299 TaxID=3364231 RepID=UPI0036A743B7
MRRVIVVAALGGALAVPPAVAAATDDGRPTAPVTLSASPQRLDIVAGLPCLPAPKITLGMANTISEPSFGDAMLTAQAPLALSRGMFSSYLPVGRTVTAPLTVRAPHGTTPGEYTVSLTSGRSELTVPVHVSAPPPQQPGDNLLRGAQANGTSTYVTSSTEFNPCGGTDGDRRWTQATGWQSAGSGQFPVYYTVTLPEPETMNRIDLYTSNSTAAKPQTHGVRDYDVQVLTAGGEWQTVAQVRGNIVVKSTSSFPAVRTTGVRIAVLASNNADYARIAEVEAYLD